MQYIITSTNENTGTTLYWINQYTFGIRHNAQHFSLSEARQMLFWSRIYFPGHFNKFPYKIIPI